MQMIRLTQPRSRCLVTCAPQTTQWTRQVVTRAPSFPWVPIRCSLLELGGSRGDGPWWSPENGQHDTTAPGFSGDTDWQQGDAPQSAG